MTVQAETNINAYRQAVADAQANFDSAKSQLESAVAAYEAKSGSQEVLPSTNEPATELPEGYSYDKNGKLRYKGKFVKETK